MPVGYYCSHLSFHVGDTPCSSWLENRPFLLRGRLVSSPEDLCSGHAWPGTACDVPVP